MSGEAKDVRSLLDPGRELLRNIAGGVKKGNSKPRIIYKGVVTYVDRVGTEYRPQFSIKAKIEGLDSFTAPVDSDPFYPPLFPPHTVCLPEIGEEVYLICEQEGNLSTGHWIARVSVNNLVTKNPVDTRNPNAESVNEKYGISTSKPIVENQDESPNNALQVPISRFKPGDTGIQGRSNTVIRTSFDLKNKKGTIEEVTGELPTNQFYETEYRRIEGSRIVYATLSDLDTLIAQRLYNLQFHSNFTAGGGFKNLDSAYLLLESLEIRLLSRNGGRIGHVVLGEQQEEWLIELIDILKQIISSINSHFHASNGVAPAVPLTQDTQLENLKPKIRNHRSRKVAAN